MKNQITKLVLAVCIMAMSTSIFAQKPQNVPYKAGWETDFEDWQVVDVKYQSKTWRWKASETVTITDSKKENDDWLISPAINCSGKKSLKVTFNAGWNKAQSSNIGLYCALNYDGNFDTAEWILVEDNIIPDSHPYGFKSDDYLRYSKNVKVSGKEIHFAIRYHSNNSPEDVQNEIRIRRFKVAGK
ncbi:hypothetical protein SAMN05444274_1165 [Mariniphaga anaerophila]|uniref:Uncharacterized protein n=1 Tax=Mariniphaga anaerophila TaxID=1484053 RepID=A0A1M5G1G3_9BACT|nr:choice-of-anchor J domain-containing protein [Mariniphaga anaerophila]SHF97282.1 hypothetical protein SAMN05444274_1165 [Mariniphaga anaerophila]